MRAREDLEKLLKNYGSKILSDLIVDNFYTNQFNIPKEKLPTDRTSFNMLQFLVIVEKAGKNKQNNLTRKNKKSSASNVSGSVTSGKDNTSDRLPADSNKIGGSKTEIDLTTVRLGNLTCTETYILQSIIKQPDLKKILLDLVECKNDEGQTVSRASLSDLDKARKILKNLDCHFLIHVVQNKLLNIQLNMQYMTKQVIQALRICRNSISHQPNLPQREELVELARILRSALTELESPSMKEKINSEVEHIEIKLESNSCFKYLKEELHKNAPTMNDILERNFVDSSSSNLSTEKLCQLLKTSKDAVIWLCGEVCSGRTTALLTLYHHWHVNTHDLNQTYGIILPLLQRPDRDTMKLSSEIIGREELVLSYLEMWAPDTINSFGKESVWQTVREVEDNTLSLCDVAHHYSTRNIEPYCKGSRVVTDWPASSSSSDELSPEQAILSRKGLRIRLLPLTLDEVSDYVESWSPKPSIYENLFYQFQNRDPLCCPYFLSIFRRVTSSVTKNLDLEVMRALVEDGLDKPDDSNVFFKIAFENMWKNESNIDHKSFNITAVPSFLVGPKDGPYKFKSLAVEEYCAAQYIAQNPYSNKWDWLRNTKRFVRVFTFVLQIWNENGSLIEYKQVIYNFMAVHTELYFKDKNGNPVISGNNEELDMALQNMGYKRSKEPFLKQWPFLFHVWMSINGDRRTQVMIVNILLQFTGWKISLDNMDSNSLTAIDMACKKTGDFVTRNGNERRKKLALKVSGKYSLEKEENCGKFVQLLSSVSQMNFPCEIALTWYYDQRDSRYGGGGSKVENFFSTLVDKNSCTQPITHYAGPFIIPRHTKALLCAGSLASLVDLRVTVYDYNSLLHILSNCPSKLAFLNLNVDLTYNQHNEKKQMPHQSQELNCNVPESCYVRVGIRYSGSFEVSPRISYSCFIQLLVLVFSISSKIGEIVIQNTF